MTTETPQQIDDRRYRMWRAMTYLESTPEGEPVGMMISEDFLIFKTTPIKKHHYTCQKKQFYNNKKQFNGR